MMTRGFHTSITASRPRLTIAAALGLVLATATVIAVLAGTLP
jgi:hypothetical protein